MGSMGLGVQWDPVTENHVVPVHREMCKYTSIPSSPGPIEPTYTSTMVVVMVSSAGFKPGACAPAARYRSGAQTLNSTELTKLLDCIHERLAVGMRNRLLCLVSTLYN